MATGFGSPVSLAQKGQWVSISEGVIAQLEKEGKKSGWPGLTGGVTVDPASGDVYMVVLRQRDLAEQEWGEEFCARGRRGGWRALRDGVCAER